MLNFINKNNLLTSEQFGFTTISSTEQAITTIFDALLDNLNNKQYTCAIFLDIKKAIYTIDYQTLLKKLYHYGFRGKFWNILKSYLENRKMCTILNKNKSKRSKITHGIPQGSVLGSLLFLLYVNDLPLASKFKSISFADGAYLHVPHQNLKTVQFRVNKEIKKVYYWMPMNKLTLNYSKCKYVIISKKDIDILLLTLIAESGYYHHSFNSEFGRKRLNHECIK